MGTSGGKKSSPLSCLLGHRWNGCTCGRCGKVRDRDHEWNPCSGMCQRCGKRCEVRHEWDGCRCVRCGAIRSEGHDWDGCVCRRCGQTRHRWDGCVCGRCGETRTLPMVFSRDGRADPRAAGHRGPWKPDPSQPCVIVCEACGQRAWEHRFDQQLSGAVGTTPGAYAAADGHRCSVCGYWTAPGCHGPKGKARKEGYVKD